MHALKIEVISWYPVLRCLDDVDDEVRDRAVMYLKVLKAPPLAETYVKDGMCVVTLARSTLNLFQILCFLYLLLRPSWFRMSMTPKLPRSHSTPLQYQKSAASKRHKRRPVRPR